MIGRLLNQSFPTNAKLSTQVEEETVIISDDKISHSESSSAINDSSQSLKNASHTQIDNNSNVREKAPVRPRSALVLSKSNYLSNNNKLPNKVLRPRSEVLISNSYKKHYGENSHKNSFVNSPVFVSQRELVKEFKSKLKASVQNNAVTVKISSVEAGVKPSQFCLDEQVLDTVEALPVFEVAEEKDERPRSLNYSTGSLDRLVQEKSSRFQRTRSLDDNTETLSGNALFIRRKLKRNKSLDLQILEQIYWSEIQLTQVSSLGPCFHNTSR